MDWIEAEAKARAGNHIGTRQVWEQALGRLAALDLPPADAHRLAQACSGPTHVTLLARLLRSSADEPEPPTMRAHFFLQAADDSDLSLAEWIEALGVFYAWLDEQGRRTRFSKALGYLHCCAEAMAGGIAFATLADGVRDMLESYGFEGEA